MLGVFLARTKVDTYQSACWRQGSQAAMGPFRPIPGCLFHLLLVELHSPVSPLAAECLHTSCYSRLVWKEGWKERLFGLSGRRSALPSLSAPVEWERPQKAHLTDDVCVPLDRFPVSCLFLTSVSPVFTGKDGDAERQDPGGAGEDAE